MITHGKDRFCKELMENEYEDSDAGGSEIYN